MSILDTLNVVGQDSTFVNSIATILGLTPLNGTIIGILSVLVVALVGVYFKSKYNYIKYYFILINLILIALKDKQITLKLLIGIIEVIYTYPKTSSGAKDAISYLQELLSTIRQTKIHIK